jgi:hypothetical protein
MQRQVKEMRAKGEEWGDRIRTSKLNRADAQQALETTILKSFEYVLCATTLSPKDCQHIMAPVYAAGLPLAGLQKNFPRIPLTGSLDAQGLEIPSLFDTQHMDHLSVALKLGSWKMVL